MILSRPPPPNLLRPPGHRKSGGAPGPGESEKVHTCGSFIACLPPGRHGAPERLPQGKRPSPSRGDPQGRERSACRADR